MLDISIGKFIQHSGQAYMARVNKGRIHARLYTPGLGLKFYIQFYFLCSVPFPQIYHHPMNFVCPFPAPQTLLLNVVQLAYLPFTPGFLSLI